MNFDKERLKELREKHLKMTQKQLGETINMEQSNISRLEKEGAKNIPKRYIEILHKNNISLDWLMGWSDIIYISDKKKPSEADTQSIKENVKTVGCDNCQEFERQKHQIEKMAKQIKELEKDRTELMRLLNRISE